MSQRQRQPHEFTPYLLREEAGARVWSLRVAGDDGLSWRAGWEDPAALEAEVRAALPAFWPGARVRCSLVECRLECKMRDGRGTGRHYSRYNVDIHVIEGGDPT